jgi:hypothetical protein
MMFWLRLSCIADEKETENYGKGNVIGLEAGWEMGHVI